MQLQPLQKPRQMKPPHRLQLPPPPPELLQLRHKN
jgi:hypothetical protein